MRSSCTCAGASRITSKGCWAVVLLGITSLAQAEIAAAADAQHRRSVRVERQVITRTAPVGTVVLRGTRPASTFVGQPTPALTQGYGSSGPTRFAPPDSSFDTSLDRSGLSPPGGILNLGQ